MSRLSPNQLTARKVETIKADGSYADGGNLWLVVDRGSRSWAFRFLSPTTRRRREMGLGSARDMSLAAARVTAATCRKLLAEGIDPIEQRKQDTALRQRQSAHDRHTVQAVGERFIADRKAEWSDPRLPGIWTSSLERLAYPVIGGKPVAAVTTEDVLAVLRPIWTTKTETADRVRGRLERILDYARTQGWREGENPARWRGHLVHILPRPSAVAKEQHHPAVPWKEIAPVMAKLRQSQGMGALAVVFTCLTAARSGEVRGARWSEIDLAARLWVVPAARMKTRREQRVPLSAPAAAAVQSVEPLRTGPDSYVFPGQGGDRPLSDVALSKALHLAAGTREVTVHGLRSTFRDWAAEATGYPRDAAEMALAHVIEDRVEAAYRRGDLLEKRREMMEEWAAYACSREGGTSSA